ncbi:DUF3558 domain-containing protein [Nocardia otitidiscaviarum]|uniref:DUF3558 domain-containing protein n=1 Tax=Nocardia otitidiscaviarum TaxID=1823 RepID=UPI0004A71BB1|nr:DUF3558 domain-containing protein [Nocardia otitidiscaviarum]MBF6134604.1 DUF3558 domain-containing protein [Nocardia otitidiscaviarum]MBF6485770.1 DUF3558 domain-containing protein [Nocardia otitidiscaviarum]
MRGVAVFLVGACALLAGACGSEDAREEAGDRPPVRVAAPGPFTGECGHVTDAEIRSTTGLSEPSDIFRNSVTCRWFHTAQHTDVTFTSYRGSPIDRERAWEALWGRDIRSLTLADHPGFLSHSPDGPTREVCVLAVQLGDDFFEWSYRGVVTHPRASCDMVQHFADLTVRRMG